MRRTAGGLFTPKNSRRRFCSARCRAAAWQANRYLQLALVEENLARTLARVRALRGTHAEA
jgi:hypothetical protein